MAMPIVALVLFAVFALLGFGWRSWEQHRRTGSTGFHGISGRPGSIEWFAGVGFIVSMAVAFFAPVLQLLGVVSPVGFLHAPWVQVTGAAIAAFGIAATVYAQLDMGDSWRIGVDKTETTTLVRKGVFVKILARGEITSKVDVSAHGVSKAAEAAITAAGGSVTVLPLPFKQGRPPVKGNQFTNR